MRNILFNIMRNILFNIIIFIFNNYNNNIKIINRYIIHIFRCTKELSDPPITVLSTE